MDHLPRPWCFEWPDTRPPQVLAANGRVVAVLSTGTIHGPDDSEQIIRAGQFIAAAPALLAACKAVEWAGRASCPGKSSRCCPECGGIKPDPKLRPGEKRDEYDWAEGAYGHRDWCELKAAIDAAERKE